MSFLASIYLWLLPLVSIPIIFHLLKKRNYRNIRFSTLRFFNVLEDDSIKRINIINILLLIIRTLILLFLILIISKPYLNGLSRNVNNKQNDVCVILIDNSYSNKNYLLKESKKIISNIINSYDDNTLFKITTIDKDVFIIDDYKKNIAPFDNAFVEISYESHNLEIKNILKNDTFNNYNNRDLYIISDMQNNIFQSEQLYDLSKWNIFLYKLFSNQNIYFSSLNIKNEFINIDELIDIDITINNNSQDNLKDHEILLFIDNINVGNNSCSIKSKFKETYNFKTSIPNHGVHKCYFSLNNEEKYYFNIYIPENIRIAIIDSDYQNSKFLINGINAYNEISENIDLKLYNTLEFSLINEQFNTVIKFDTYDMNKELLNKISMHTNNLIIIPNDELNLNLIYNYFNIKDEYTPDKILIENGYIQINNKKTKDNDLKKILTNNSKIEVYEYFKIPENKSSIIILENHDTFMNRYQKNDFKLTLFSSPLNIESNNLPINGSFIPIINKLIIKSDREYQYEIGDTISLGNYLSSNKITHIINKDTSSYNSENLINNMIFLKKPGYHKIITGNQSINVSSNIPEIEYNDTYINDNKLSEYFNNYTYINDISELNDLLKFQISGIHLWRYFLYGIIVLIIVEMFLSNIYIYKND